MMSCAQHTIGVMMLWVSEILNEWMNKLTCHPFWGLGRWHLFIKETSHHSYLADQGQCSAWNLGQPEGQHSSPHPPPPQGHFSCQPDEMLTGLEVCVLLPAMRRSLDRSHVCLVFVWAWCVNVCVRVCAYMCAYSRMKRQIYLVRSLHHPAIQL